MNYSMPGFSVFHYLLEFAQTVCDAIIFSGFIHVAICVSALLFYMVIIELYHIYLRIHQLLYIEYQMLCWLVLANTPKLEAN